jgi:hypothetical protein
MPLKSATTSTTRANPAKECNNVTFPVAGEITIRQPHVEDYFPKTNGRLASQQTREELRAGGDYAILELPVGDHGAVWVAHLDGPVAVDCDALMGAVTRRFLLRLGTLGGFLLGFFGLRLRKCRGR